MSTARDGSAELTLLCTPITPKASPLRSMWRTNVPSGPLSLQLNDQNARVVLVHLGGQLFALHVRRDGRLDFGDARQRVVALANDEA